MKKSGKSCSWLFAIINLLFFTNSSSCGPKRTIDPKALNRKLENELMKKKTELIDKKIKNLQKELVILEKEKKALAGNVSKIQEISDKQEKVNKEIRELYIQKDEPKPVEQPSPEEVPNNQGVENPEEQRPEEQKPEDQKPPLNTKKELTIEDVKNNIKTFLEYMYKDDTLISLGDPDYPHQPLINSAKTEIKRMYYTKDFLLFFGYKFAKSNDGSPCSVITYEVLQNVIDLIKKDQNIKQILQILGIVKITKETDKVEFIESTKLLTKPKDEEKAYVDLFYDEKNKKEKIQEYIELCEGTTKLDPEDITMQCFYSRIYEWIHNIK